MKKAVGYAVLVLLLAAAGFFVYKAFVPSTNFDFVYRLFRFSRTEEVSLFFTRGEAVIPAVRKLPRIKPVDQETRNAVMLLLQGPDEAEKTAGYDSALPPEAQLLSAFLENDVIFLNFSPQIGEGGGTELMRTRLRQIVYTATQFPGVNKVRFLIDGQPIKYFSSEGLTEVEHPIGRADLEMEEK